MTFSLWIDSYSQKGGDDDDDDNVDDVVWVVLSLSFCLYVGTRVALLSVFSFISCLYSLSSPPAIFAVFMCVIMFVSVFLICGFRASGE